MVSCHGATNLLAGNVLCRQVCGSAVAFAFQECIVLRSAICIGFTARYFDRTAPCFSPTQRPQSCLISFMGLADLLIWALMQCASGDIRMWFYFIPQKLVKKLDGLLHT